MEVAGGVPGPEEMLKIRGQSRSSWRRSSPSTARLKRANSFYNRATSGEQRTRKKKESAEVLEFAIDDEDYRRFEKLVDSQRLTRDEALRTVLIKGMQAYWPQQLADMVSDHARLKERIEQYKKDNDLLNKMYSQNFEFKKLLSQTKEATGRA
ncbi:MAG: hypothetical protein KGI38_03375 [Thaumarchaeota archaeon]|nr:hypothetical protein [Nitrososphaerota archaeon]